MGPQGEAGSPEEAASSPGVRGWCGIKEMVGREIFGVYFEAEASSPCSRFGGGL